MWVYNVSLCIQWNRKSIPLIMTGIHMFTNVYTYDWISHHKFILTFILISHAEGLQACMSVTTRKQFCTTYVCLWFQAMLRLMNNMKIYKSTVIEKREYHVGISAGLKKYAWSMISRNRALYFEYLAEVTILSPFSTPVRTMSSIPQECLHCCHEHNLQHLLLPQTIKSFPHHE